MGEFVEVSNNSESDPAAWVARIIKITKKAATVEYPFHDTPNEAHKVGMPWLSFGYYSAAEGRARSTVNT